MASSASLERGACRMNALTRPRSLIIGLLAVLALALFPASADANHSWGGYHWARTANPFTIKLGDNVSGLWDGMLVTASKDWSQSNVLDTTIVPGGARPRNCRPTSGRVAVYNDRYGNTGWICVAYDVVR